MSEAAPSARKIELLEAAYGYALEHGIADVSLRPLAAAIGSSPRVLLYLFGSKEGLIQALLARARSDELALLDRLRREQPDADVPGAVVELWHWLSDPRHRALLVLWVEGYARSLVDPAGPGRLRPPDGGRLAAGLRRVPAGGPAADRRR